MSHTLLGIFLIGHAVAHAGLTAAPNPSDPESTPGTFFTQKNRNWLFHRTNLDSGLVQKNWENSGIYLSSGFCPVWFRQFRPTRTKPDLAWFGRDNSYCIVDFIDTVLASLAHSWCCIKHRARYFYVAE